MKLVRGPLAKLRLKSKLTSEKAAELIGCSRTWLGRIERGESNPSPELAERMAELFNIPVEEIAGLVKATQKQYLKHLIG